MSTFEVSGPAGVLRGLHEQPGGGDALPVLFVHPINLRGGCWVDVARALTPRRRCLMPDLRGHGGSDPSGPFGLAEWTADLITVMEAFDVPRAHVVGGSLGGPLAISLAATAPDRVASITAIGSALAITGDDVEVVLEVLAEKGVAGMFRDVLPRISFAPGTAWEVIERGLELANPNDVETVAAVWGATISADATDLAGHVRCPALVITGEHDVTCTPAQGEELAAGLGTTCTIMPGVGHLPMLEAPAGLGAMVSEFIAGCDPVR